MFYRHSSMKTLQMSKSFKLLQSPILMQNRHLSDDSYTQLILHYTMAYAENSIMAKGFVYSYQAIGSVSCLECTGGVIGAALALRLLTFPLFALSEKLVAKRMIANQLIRRQVYEDAAAHYGEKAVVDPKTGRMTLALPDKLTNYENMKRNTKLEKIEELSGKLMYVVPMQSTLRRLFIYTMTGVTCAASIGITYVLTQMPAIQSLYMCTLLFTAVAQTLALRHPRVKQLLGIGRLPTDSKTPFRDLFKGRRKVMPSTVV
uniref:Transmembrane protein n=1 Tax=Meloidogyne hapla TaxID=6305 RepID=A0A1I8B1Y3_MELHA